MAKLDKVNEVESLYESLLSKNLIETDALSKDDKKVLATLASYSIELEDDEFFYLSNNDLRESCRMDYSNMIRSLKVLEFYYLIERRAGKRRVKGEKSQASSYKVNFENFDKPLKTMKLYEMMIEKRKRKSPETSINTVVQNSLDKYSLDKISKDKYSLDKISKDKYSLDKIRIENKSKEKNISYKISKDKETNNTNKNQLSVEEFKIDTMFTEYKPKESDGLREHYAKQLGQITKQTADAVEKELNLLS